jgi:hypothetical protein
MRLNVLAVGFVLGLTSLASASLVDNFEYTTQAQFQAAWTPYSADGSSMTLVPGQGHNSTTGYNGVATTNYVSRNARNLDSFTDYKGTDTAPVKFEYWLYDSDPTSQAGVGARNFNELRAYNTNGFPAYAQSSNCLQGTIAMGLYNSPVSSRNFHARVYYGGVNAWFNLNTPRTAGWHKLTALIGDASVKFMVDNVLDTTVALTNSSKVFAFDSVVLGSGLTSAGYNATFDDLSVAKQSLAAVPEPVTMILLAMGGLFMRRRK